MKEAINGIIDKLTDAAPLLEVDLAEHRKHPRGWRKIEFACALKIGHFRHNIPFESLVRVPFELLQDKEAIRTGPLMDDLEAFLERMRPTLGAALAKLAGTSFRADPIGGDRYSRATSIISSAYKRHGQILGRALLERLKDCARYQVWTEDRFKLGMASRYELQKAMPPLAYRQIALPYGEAEQIIPIDLLVHDTTDGSIRSYNVKRGNGSYDAGKRRQIFDELLRTQMHLSQYARSMGIESAHASAHIIFYYGLRSIPEPWSLASEDLDEHFRFPVLDAIETVNDRFRQGLHSLIEDGVAS
jgi:hypothetical protein